MLFRQATQLAPEFAEAHARLAIALANNQGDWDRKEALQAAELALSLNAGSGEVQYAMASVLVRDGRIKEAFSFFEQATVLSPSDSEIRMAYGSAYANIFDISHATEQWEKSLFLDPLSAATMRQIGHTREKAAVQKGMRGLEFDYKPATVYFRRAVTFEPDSLEVRFDLMFHLWRIGRLVESMQIALQIHQIDPGNFLAINHIVSTLTNTGQVQTAHRWIDKLPDTFVHRRNAFLTRLLRKEEKFSAAIVLTKTWFEDYPKNPLAKIEYAISLAASRHETSAQENSNESTQRLGLARQLLHDFVTDDTGNYFMFADANLMSVELTLADAMDDHKNAQSLANLIIQRYESQPFRRTGTSIHAALAYTVWENAAQQSKKFWSCRSLA